MTPTETAFAEDLFGPTLHAQKVRLAKNAPLRAYTFRIPKRPRVACKERIFPEPTTDVMTGSPAAAVMFNRVYFSRNFSLKDYTPTYPDQLYLYEAMLLAHELTHVWQWQNRALTGYHPLKAAREHRTSQDPYLFDPDVTRDFLSYGYEQQGAIVEEYLCCATLDPEAPRTGRLRDMLLKYFPISKLPDVDTIVGWRGAQLENICR